MKKPLSFIITLTLLLVFAPSSHSQDWGFKFGAGLATYRMDDLKYLQEDILGTYPVEGKITSSFPPYTAASITLYKQIYDHLGVGGGYSFSTTGGKSSYADYSGQIYTEMSASSHRLGAYIAYMLSGGERLELSLTGRLDANYTSLSIESYYTIYNYSNGLSNQYRSLSPTATVGSELMYKLQNFALGMELGYMVDLKGKLQDTGDGDDLLDPNDSERVLRSDWSGWFVQLKTLINLNL